MEEFITPEGHKDFLAKKLFDRMGSIQWGALAYIEPNGGGPQGNHTHPEDHIFIVAEGRVEILLGDQARTVEKDGMLYVQGSIPHSIWNRGKETAKVIKISVTQEAERS